MKIAISIPNKTFEALEKIAAERDLTRSALYTQALEKMLFEIEQNTLTERINQAVANGATGPDTVWQAHATQMLERVEW
jgi:predicted transcriptional regulator